jgi:hypothetical protein
MQMKRLNNVLILAAVPLMAVAACGDDAGGGGGASPKQAALGAADAAVDMQELAETPGNEGALAGVMQLHANVQTMERLNAAADLGAGISLKSALATVQQALDAGCYSTTGDTTTYTDCEVANTTFSGTATSSGTSVAVDLTIDADTSAYDAGAYAPQGAASVTIDDVTVHEYGGLDYAGNAVVGVMNFDIMTTITVDFGSLGGGFNIPGADQGPTTSTQETNLTADFDLTLTDGCATGGTMTVTSGSGGSTNTVVATYGPACGDVEVE